MKHFPWRGLLYAVVLGYLLLDLKIWNGPLKKAITKRQDAALEVAREERWVAIVNREPITQNQLNLAVFRHLYQRGKEPAEVPDKNLFMIRRAVLQRLIDDTLIRQYADGENFTAPEDEIEAFIQAWESQFASLEELEGRSDLQRLTPEERHEELGRIWSRKRWIEDRIAPGIEVSETEMRTWYEANRESGEGFTEPAKLRARHLFLSTVEKDDASREELIWSLHTQLVNKESTFEEVAKEFSEDLRTKTQGGDLGWFTGERLADDFTEVVLSMKPGELSEPFRTRIGWHIVEVTDSQPASELTYEELADEIRVHLENELTAEVIQQLIKGRRTVANIQLFPENI
ncbi:MAG: peptidylprolyl isomerase [Verrucomicrobiota bacterium]